MLQKILSVIISLFIGTGSLSLGALPDIRDIVSVMIFGIPVSEHAVNNEKITAVKDSDVIKIKSSCGIVRDKIALIIDPSAGLLKKYSLFASEGLTAAGWCTPADMYVVSAPLSGANDIFSECARLEQREEVLMAVPLVASKISSAYTPDDPFDYYGDPVWNELDPSGSNWWLEAVSARQAWDYSGLYSPVTVGVVDDGVDYEHEELSGFVGAPDSKQASRNVPDDHGTHVCGIISARGGNSVGISGIVPGTRIIHCDWNPGEGQKWNTDIAILFDFVKVVKSGAKVINYSLGKSKSIEGDSNTLGDFDIKTDGWLYSYAVAALLDRGYDFLVVMSAGNGNADSKPVDGRNAGLFAAIFSGNVFTGLHMKQAGDIINHIILAGAAENVRGGYMQCYFSNGGSEVELFAPGRSVYSTVASGYGYMSGTSMAAPVITAIASMVWGVNPAFTGGKVKEILLSSCCDEAKLNDSTEYFGRQQNTAKPMVNAALAVEKALTLTYGSLARISGRVDGAENGTAVYKGRSYTVLPDGSYSFLVLDDGSGELTVYSKTGEQVFPAPANDSPADDTAPAQAVSQAEPLQSDTPALQPDEIIAD